MKNKFLLGAVSGVTALAVGFPILAQVTSAQTAAPSSQPALEDRWSAERPPLDADMVQEMIDRDQALLDNVDEMVTALKSATEAHKAALSAALSISDEDARADAVRSADEARRSAMEAAISANPDLKGVLPFGPGGHGRGGMMRGPGPEKLAETLGMTADELKAAIDSGKTIEQIAQEKGVTLPERPAFGGKHEEKLAEALGLTVDELKAELDAGKTPEQIAEEKGVELPAPPAFGGMGMMMRHGFGRGPAESGETVAQ
jgi:hypothetical protein